MTTVAGVDEVGGRSACRRGRGRSRDSRSNVTVDGLGDSKLLTPKRR